LPFTSLFFSCSVAHRYLHSFPTRRSSDLWTGDGPAIDAGHFVAGAEIVAVIELIDLRSHLWFEPALKANRGHGGFSDDRELVGQDRKSTRLNSSHRTISYAVFCLKKKTTK